MGATGDHEGMRSQMWQMMWEMFSESFGKGPGRNYPSGDTFQFRDQARKVALDEKYFRRIEKFDGDVNKFRGWMFDLLVALGTIDKDLSRELKSLLTRDLGNVTPERWESLNDLDLNQGIYDKYTSELFGVICSWTSGEAKNLVKGIVDAGYGHDGFKGLLILNRRFDVKTSASLLQSYLEVVSPRPIRNVLDVANCIHHWEAKCAALKSRYDEDLGENLKLAILVGMLPKDFQDVVLHWIH